MTLRLRLIQCRDPGDPVIPEEIAAFADALGVTTDAIVPHDALSASLRLRDVTRDVDAVLVGGSGDYSVLDRTAWMPSFVGLLGELASADVPTFASCFGFQGMVLALGGEVQSHPPAAEVGSFDVFRTVASADDPLLDGVPAQFVAQLGHKDSAMRLPASATHLLSSERCMHQMIRVGRNVYATQFHPELTVDRNRQRFQRYAAAYAKAFGSGAADEVRDAFRPSPEASSLLPRFLKVVLGR